MIVIGSFCIQGFSPCYGPMDVCLSVAPVAAQKSGVRPLTDCSSVALQVLLHQPHLRIIENEVARLEQAHVSGTIQYAGHLMGSRWAFKLSTGSTECIQHRYGCMGLFLLRELAANGGASSC